MSRCVNPAVNKDEFVVEKQPRSGATAAVVISFEMETSRILYRYRRL
jgi:hypothetical protein